MREYSPVELKCRLEAGDFRPLLIDVRDAWEYEICHLEGSLNVPLAEITARAGELPRDTELVMICHHGIRSFSAGQFLLHSGFDRVANLDGGIDAWAAVVDGRMARY